MSMLILIMWKIHIFISYALSSLPAPKTFKGILKSGFFLLLSRFIQKRTIFNQNFWS